MNKFAFYDAKPYDRVWFDKYKDEFGVEIKYIENKLNIDTVGLSSGCRGVIAFVNDNLESSVIDALYDKGVRLIALRCAGYNNVDLKAAEGRISVVRVPEYSPYAVAEYAMALLFAVNRKIHRAYLRTRDFDFSIDGLTGFDLYGKTVGVVGTGKIGRVFIDICRGIGMRTLAYDPYPNKEVKAEYVDLDTLYHESDIISLHCPLTRDTRRMINAGSIEKMKKGAVIINTSRGALIHAEALLEAIKAHKIGGAGLDVYEEETDLFYEDFSDTIIQDDILARLLSMPNVILTSHQAFLTDEALKNIALITLGNIQCFLKGEACENVISYSCLHR